MPNTTKKPPGPAQLNATALVQECEWFSRVAEARMGLYFEQDVKINSIEEIEPPVLSSDSSPYAQLVNQLGFGFNERLVLILALIPHIRPQLLDIFIVGNNKLKRVYTEFGGQRSSCHRGFLPTLETAVFVLAGDDLARRFEVQALFENDHAFNTQDILYHDHTPEHEPRLSALLSASGAALRKLTTGISYKPDFSIQFPARLMSTRLTWDDLVLHENIMSQIEHINAWLRHQSTIIEDWGLGRHLKPGFRCLLHGPPGTGKTLTTTLIGATGGADVYRVDLSATVSKYIGETEKNLARIFEQAKNKNWILFFDEADALFGKRTQVSDSHDRYANQEVSYLLQRIEDFPGLVILSTNSKSDIDAALARRFQLVIYFPMPDAEQRLRLWRGVIGSEIHLHPDVDLEQWASEYALSGGAIVNVVRYAATNALRLDRKIINAEDLLRGIRKELSGDKKL